MTRSRWSLLNWPCLGFWFAFSGWSSLSVPRLVIFHWDPKSNGETKRVYLLVINKNVRVVVRYITYTRVSGKRIVVSRVKVQIQVISVPQCHSVAFEVIQSLGAFRKASSSTKLVENPGTSSLASYLTWWRMFNALLHWTSWESLAREECKIRRLSQLILGGFVRKWTSELCESVIQV